MAHGQRATGQLAGKEAECISSPDARGAEVPRGNAIEAAHGEARHATGTRGPNGAHGIRSPGGLALLTHVNQANQWLGPREANTARPH